MTLGEDQAKTNADLAAGMSSLTQGLCTAIDWTKGLVTVNIAGGSVPMPMVGPAPFVGFKVWVGYLGTQPICLGIVARAAAGVVVGTPSGGIAQVTGDDGQTYQLGYIGTAPAAGNRVALDWGAGGRILGVPSFEVVASSGSTPAALPPQAKQFEFRPTDSKNWYGGSGYTNGIAGSEVWCSQNNKGVYVYGTAIGDSVPDSATFVPGSLRVFLAEFYNQFPSSLAQLGQTALTSLSGDPAPANLVSIPDCRGGAWVTLPDSWEAAFRTGTMAGLAFNNGPGYHKYRPAGVENSGVIVGTWKV